MRRILNRARRSRSHASTPAADEATAITETSTVDPSLAPDFFGIYDETAPFPLEFLDDDFYWDATIVRSAIVNAIGNIQATEDTCRASFANGNQTFAQIEVRTQVHRNQVQRLAQLGNRHAQLCYSFNHSELLSGTVDAFEDPTCRLAIRNCFAEVCAVRPTLSNSDINLHTQHPLVVPIVRKWYSPAFSCTEADFHARVWVRSQLPIWDNAGVAISTRTYEG
jgi:hypothetical protein